MTSFYFSKQKFKLEKMQISFQNYNVGVLNLNIIFYECLNNESYLNRGNIKISLFSSIYYFEVLCTWDYRLKTH